MQNRTPNLQVVDLTRKFLIFPPINVNHLVIRSSHKYQILNESAGYFSAGKYNIAYGHLDISMYLPKREVDFMKIKRTL